jgi:hypothetical protein
MKNKEINMKMGKLVSGAQDYRMHSTQRDTLTQDMRVKVWS